MQEFYCPNQGTMLVFKCALLAPLVGIDPTTTGGLTGRLAAGVLLS